MYLTQKLSVAKSFADAPAASKAATPELLAHLDSANFRKMLTDCCNRSGIAAWAAKDLLDALNAILQASELVHNFDGEATFETDATIEIGLYNATEYFPTTWQLRWLEYYGERFNPRWGFPGSCEGVGEESEFNCAPFAGPHDEPLTYRAASSRLIYIALNALRVDVGNPSFGNVTAIFAPSFWKDSVVAAPVDSGLYTMICNETYRKTPGAHYIHGKYGMRCDKGVINPPGVFGHMNHVLLNNMRFWSNGTDMLARMFTRTYGDPGAPALTNVSRGELAQYIEPNILANARYDQRGVKLLVGAFAPLFGTARGELLQKWAKARGVALAWGVAAADGGHDESHHHSHAVGFAGDVRLVDVPSSAKLLNASMTAADAGQFGKLWREMAAARDPKSGAIDSAVVWSLWAKARQTLSAGLQVALPRAGDCADFERCLGLAADDKCVCYASI